MAISQQELASKMGQLKRSPAPKPPGNQLQSPAVGMGAIDLGSVHLRKTGKRESLIAEDMERDKENELASVFAKRKMFEHDNEKAVTLPRIAPKPNRKPSDGDTRKPRSESVPDESTTDTNSNIVKSNGVPNLRPLPTLQSIGRNPPPKPTKPPILSMKVKKYKNHKVIIAPKIKEVIAEEVKNGTFDQVSDTNDDNVIEEDIYDDVNTDIPMEPIRPPKPSIPPPQPAEPEPIMEDTYDDVEQLAEVVKLQLANDNKQPRVQSSHVENDSDEHFGEDLYDPIQGTFSIEQTNDVEDADMEDGEQQQESSSQQPSKEDTKAKKEREKKERELQKKKEREELRRKKEEEKREKEDKKKKEDERKRREKLDKELKKTHKLKGNEEAVSQGTTKEEFSGSGKLDLACTRGAYLEVIIKENCPQGKWLVRDEEGHYGYVSSEVLVLEENPGDASMDENLDEDLYECVDTFQGQSAPQPPPPTSTPAEGAPDFPDELYDDTLVQDDDFYDDIPGAH